MIENVKVPRNRAELERVIALAELNGAERVLSAMSSARQYGLVPGHEAERMARIIRQELEDIDAR